MPIEYLDEPQQPEPPRSWGDTLRNFREGSNASTSGIISGIPVLGPALLRGAEGIAAAPGRALGLDMPRESYSDRVMREHPVASTVGEVTGSVVSGVPAMRAFPALAGGSSMWGRAAAGAGLGGADAAVRSGGDPASIATGAAIGGVAPAAAEVLAPVGSAVASGTRWLADRAPGVRSVLAPKIAPAASQAIHDTADAGYNAVRNLPVRFNPAEVSALSQQMGRRLDHLGAYRDGVGEVAHQALDRLSRRPPTPAGLYSVVDELKEQGARLGGKGKLAADSVRQEIESFLETPVPGRVLVGHAEAATIGPRMADNKANWRAYKNAQLVQGKLDEAALKASSAYSGLNKDNTVRQRITSGILTSPKASRFLRPQDRTALEDVARGSWGGNALRYGSGLLGGGGGLGAMLTGAVAGAGSLGADIAGGGSIDPYRALGAVGLGLAARKGANAITRNAAQEAERAIRASAPLSQQMVRAAQMPPTSMTPAIRPSSLNAMQHRDEIARLLALQANREVSNAP